MCTCYILPIICSLVYIFAFAKPVNVAYIEAREDAQAVSDYISGCSDDLTYLDPKSLKKATLGLRIELKKPKSMPG